MKRVPLDPGLDPYSLFAASRVDPPHAFILESLSGPARLAERTFVGFDPEMIISYRAGVLRSNGETSKPYRPIAALRSILAKHDASGTHGRYVGGLDGYVSYEFVRNLDSVPAHADSPLPEFEFGLYLDGVIVDHVLRRAEYFSHGRSRVEDLPKAAKTEPELHADPPKPQIGQGRFMEAVRTAKEAIAEGDAFQVVLSRRDYGRMTGAPLAFYEALRAMNLSPYMYYLDFGVRRVIGASPEMLLRVEDLTATTFPIAGTRPAGTTLPETERFRTELLADEKERAEHMMLVDLGRNDLGRVCRFGTVRVPELMGLERYSHVTHIVSSVVGELADGRDALDALVATFPAGTLSGAPKIRAMEIIDELEPLPRGLYGGAVGYIDLRGNLDFCITIRTLLLERGRAVVQAGAGIVADSDPDAEQRETEAKAAALVEALGLAGEL